MFFPQPMSQIECKNLSHLQKASPGCHPGVHLLTHRFISLLQTNVLSSHHHFCGDKPFLQSIILSTPSHFTDDFKLLLLNAKTIDIQLSLQLQTGPIRDEVCTNGIGKQHSEDFRSLSATTRWPFSTITLLESRHQEDRAIFFLHSGTARRGISTVSFAGNLLTTLVRVYLIEVAAPWW